MNNSCRNFSKQTFNEIDANDFLLNKQKTEQNKLLYIWYSNTNYYMHIIALLLMIMELSEKKVDENSNKQYLSTKSEKPTKCHYICDLYMNINR